MEKHILYAPSHFDTVHYTLNCDDKGKSHFGCRYKLLLTEHLSTVSAGQRNAQCKMTAHVLTIRTDWA